MSVNVPEFSVSEFSRSIKRVVEDAFGFVRIKGEITGFKRASSGHLYFNLKDEGATLAAVCFRASAAAIDFEIADGLQVCAYGKITTFEGRSNYQIIVEKVEIAGIGALLEMLEKRRQKLASEGLFDAIHKKALPFFPQKIGVITSETGAVIQDIIHRLQDRCGVHLLIYPSAVQGEKAAAEVIAGIKYFDKLKGENRPDLLIVARGGGSFEDLMPFNDEALVRAVFACEIPLISAVGHETDTTLIDFVSDLRAPTPTAAAELATPVLSELKNHLKYFEQKINLAANNFIAQRQQHLSNLQKYIVDPARVVDQMQERFLLIEKRVKFAAMNFLEKKFQKLSAMQISGSEIFYRINSDFSKIENALQHLKSKIDADLKMKDLHLKNLVKLLKSHHYNEILKRGFALIRSEKGEVISSLSHIKSKQKIVTELCDGEFSSYVLDLDNKGLEAKEKKSDSVIQPKFI